MTARLEEAIKKLSPEELERLTSMAESLAQQHATPSPDKTLKLTWVGCLAGEGDQDGVDAQRRADQLRMELLDKSMPK